MDKLVSGIWQNTPAWVWPLFCVLLFIGFMAMRTRTSSIIPYFFYPLFGLAAVNSINNLVHTPTKWLVFAVSYVVGAAIAFHWQDGLILEKSGWKMKLRGEHITIVILMTIFFSNFTDGVMEAVAPQIRESMIFTIIFAGVIGVCSGSFTGRALRVVTLKEHRVMV